MRNQQAKIIKIYIFYFPFIYIYSLYVHRSSDLASRCGCCLRIHDIVVHARLGLRLALALPSLKTCSCLQEGCWASWLDQNLVFICLFNFNNCILHETPNISPLAWSELCVHMLACIQHLYFAWNKTSAPLLDVIRCSTCTTLLFIQVGGGCIRTHRTVPLARGAGG